MNIRELKLFRHLTGTLHFGKTSQACNITPSGLTRAMQRLENELGHELFYRSRRSVSLTPAGEIFKEYAEEAIFSWYRLQDRLRGDNTLQGELTVYCSVTAILSILPELLTTFRSSHPEVQLHLETGDAAIALNKLQSAEADIAVAALPDKLPEGHDFLELVSTPLIFIGPTGENHSITYKNGTIDWRRSPIIVPERGLSRERVDRWFSNMNISPNIYSQVAGNEAIIAMVGMGCGIGVVPQLVLDQSLLKDQVSILQVQPELKPFSVGICTLDKNRQNPVVETFWDTAVAKFH